MNQSDHVLIDRAIKKSSIGPIKVDFDVDETLKGNVYRAINTAHLAAVRNFRQLWKLESGSDWTPECLTSEEKHFYLICAPLLRSGSTRVAIGAIEIKTLDVRPCLDWVWLHPHFRREMNGKSIAKDALIAVSEIYESLEMHPEGGDLAKLRMNAL